MAALPKGLLEKAKCVAIIPGEEKAALIFGGTYGKGIGDLLDHARLEYSDVCGCGRGLFAK